MTKKGLLGGKYSKEEEEKREPKKKPLEEKEIVSLLDKEDENQMEEEVEPEKRKAPIKDTPAKRFRKVGGMVSSPGLHFATVYFGLG